MKIKCFYLFIYNLLKVSPRLLTQFSNIKNLKSKSIVQKY